MNSYLLTCALCILVIITAASATDPDLTVSISDNTASSLNASWTFVSAPNYACTGFEVNTTSFYTTQQLLTTINDCSQTSLVIIGLHPGTPYNVTVVAFFNPTGVNNPDDTSTVPYTGPHSTATTKSGTTNPNALTSVTFSTSDTSSITLAVAYNFSSGSCTGFQVNITASNSATQPLNSTVIQGCSINLARVTSLAAGVTVTLTVAAFYISPDDGQTYVGQTSSVNASTVPLPPTTTTLLSRSSSSIAFNWTAPTSGSYLGFVVFFNGQRNSPTTALSFTTNSLSPGKRYVFAVSAYSDPSATVISANTSAIYYTVPLPASVGNSIALNSTAVSVSWTIPGTTVCSGIQVTATNLSSAASSPPTITLINCTASPYIVTNLYPGAIYNVVLTTFVNASDDSSQPSGSQLFGSPLTVTATAKPLPPTSLNIVTRMSTFLLVSFMAPVGSVFSSFTGTAVNGSYNSSTVQVTNSTSGTYTMNFTGLTAGVPYTITIYSISNGMSSDGSLVNSNIYTLPLPPTAITLTSRSTSSIAFSWTAPTTGSYRGFVVFNIGQQNSTTTAPSFTANSLSPGKRYVFAVSAYSDPSATVISTSVTATFYTVPLPAANGTWIALNSTAVSVSWTIPGTTECSGIQVAETSLSPAVSFSSTITLTSCSASLYIVTNLYPGAIYNVVLTTFVTASDDSSQPSGSQLFGSPLAVTAIAKPLPPTNFNVVTRMSTFLLVSFMAPVGSVFSSFTGTAGNSAYGSSTVTVTNSTSGTYTMNFTGLTAGVSYTITISSISNGVSSDGSLVNSSIYTLPATPSRLTWAAITSTNVSLTWSAPTTGVFNNFLIVVSSPLSRNFTYPSSANSAVIGGLLPGTQYTFNLYSTITAGYYSNPPITFTVTTRPLPVTNLAAISDFQANIYVSWNIPSSPYNSFTYSLVGGDGSNALTITNTTTATFFNASSLIYGATYTTTVTTNKDGMTSDIVPSITRTIAPADVNSFTVSTFGSQSITVYWNPPSVGIFDEYVLSWLAQSTGAVTNSSSQKIGNSYQITGLSPGETYNITIQSTSNSIKSAGKTISQTTEPDSVTDIIVNQTTTLSLLIQWLPPLNASFITSYEVSISPNDGNEILPVVVNPSNALSHLFNKLLPGRLYNVTVTSVSNGQKKSNIKQFSTKPLPVQLSITDINEYQISISWSINSTSQQDSFQVSCEPGFNSLQLSGTTTSHTFLLSLFRSGSAYNLSVNALSNLVAGDKTTVSNVITKPLPIQGLTSTPINCSTFQLGWLYPSSNSAVTLFIVNTTRTDVSFPSLSTMTVTAMGDAAYTTLVPNLFPGATYNFTVTPMSSGQSGNFSLVMNTTYPLSPAVTVLTDLTTPTTLTINQTYDSSKSVMPQWQACSSVVNSQTPTCSTALDIMANTSYTFHGLAPGEVYSVTVTGIVQTPTNNNQFSQTPSSAIGIAQPLITTVITQSSIGNDSVTVDYLPEPEHSTVFDFYIFSIQQQSVVKMKGDTPRQVTFSGLTAGTIYSVSAVTVSGLGQPYNQSSATRTSPHFVTVPNSPTFNCQPVSTDSRTLNIIVTAPTQGACTYFRIKLSSSDSPNVPPQDHTVTVTSNLMTIPVSSLLPNKVYKVDVQCFVLLDTDRTYSEATSTNCTTSEGTPGPVSNFNCSAPADLPNTVHCTWGIPASPNGIIRNYTLTVMNDAGQTVNEVILDPSNTAYVFNGLTADSSYTIKIYATTVSPGDISTFAVTTSIREPPQPDPSVPAIAFNSSDITTSSVKLQLNNTFTSQYGAVTNYSFVVTTTQYKINPTDSQIVTWSQAQGQNPQPPYFAVFHCPDLFVSDNHCGTKSRKRRSAMGGTGSIVTFNLGSDSSCGTQMSCNGPLSASTTYYVYIRAYNRLGQFTDTSYTVIKTNDALPVGMIVGVVIAGVVVIAAIIILIVFLVYRRKKGGKDKSHYAYLPSTKQKISNPVALTEFSNHVEKMSRDSNLLFSQEYEELKSVGIGLEKTAAELEVNRPKNRYTNILPYDVTRIRLRGSEIDDGSDYINANWMPGYTSRREFIAAQGPLQSTVDDFWRMVWEYNSPVIVMLTKWMENGREKCARYIPSDNEPVYFGDIVVQITSIVEFPEWIKTTIACSLGTEARTIVHYFYTMWPDFGVPSSSDSLLSFIRAVRTSLNPQQGPAVIHCSAGVGRTGAYISLDRMVQQCAEHAFVDIFGTVFEMRKHRCCMVQTEEQYIFIHKVTEYLLNGETGDESEGVDNAVYVNFEVKEKE